jgi:hypothetical protein
VLDGIDTTLVDSWDGNSWSQVTGTPNVDATTDSNDLYGVACSDSTHCAAVGAYGLPDPTLILMYEPPEATVPATGGGAGVPGPALGLLVLGAGLVALLLTTPVAARRRQRHR